MGCSVPSNFDMDYAYSLGATSAILATTKRSGYMAIVSNLAQPVDKWIAGGVPLTAMLKVPELSSGDKPSIPPNSIDLEGAAYRLWFEQRLACGKAELYESPGPIQLSGLHAEDRAMTISSKFSYLTEMDGLAESLTKIGKRCRPGADPKAMRVAAQTLSLLNNILDELAGPTDAVES